MDLYHKKYLKYKNKYINLKLSASNNLKGGEREIFDFDEVFLNDNNKYLSEFLLDKKLSSDSIDYIKSNFQFLYKIYYEYLTNTTCEKLLIPIYTNINDPSKYRVNYVEQAKFYNFNENNLLGNIDTIDSIIEKSFKNIIDELRKLESYGYINLNKIILCIEDLKSPCEKVFFNNIFDKIIDILKNNQSIIIDNFIKQNIDDRIFNIDSYMIIIKNIITNGFYKIDDNYKIIFGLNIDKDNFITENDIFLINEIYEFNINHNTNIKILLEMYKKIHNIIITDTNIEKIKYFIDLLQNIRLNIIDNNNNSVTYDMLINEYIKNIIEKYLEIKNKFIKLYLNTQTFKKLLNDNIQNINKQLEILKKYNGLYSFKNMYVNFLNPLDIVNINEEQILINVNNNKEKFIRKIIEEFYNDDTKNDKIIEITLQYIRELSLDDKDFTKDNKYESELHANLIILSKFKYQNKTCILGRRIEPHRHSNTYCRNSVRKEIRDIFDRLPNFYYVDYYMKNHMGLQINECVDIKKDYIQQYFDVVNPDIPCQFSQLYKIDGFCASWCAYIASILLLNKSIEIRDISKYFTTFNINDDKSFVDEYIEEYVKIDKDDKIKLEEFRKDFLNFFENKMFRYSQFGFRYTYIKTLKLYTFIIYYCKFISEKYNIITKLFPSEDFNNLGDTYKFYKSKHFNTTVSEKIKNSQQILINPDDEILKKTYLHSCEDKLFNHEEMCLEQETCKDIPAELKDICDNKEKICIKLQIRDKLNKKEVEIIKKFKDFYIDHINPYVTE